MLYAIVFIYFLLIRKKSLLNKRVFSATQIICCKKEISRHTPAIAL